MYIHIGLLDGISVCTELMNVSFCLLINTCESVCRSPQENTHTYTHTHTHIQWCIYLYLNNKPMFNVWVLKPSSG